MWLSPDKTNQPLYLQILGARLGFQDGLLGSACVVAVNILVAFLMVLQEWVGSQSSGSAQGTDTSWKEPVPPMGVHTSLVPVGVPITSGVGADIVASTVILDVSELQ